MPRNHPASPNPGRDSGSASTDTDPNDPIYEGFNYMFQVVEQLQAQEPETRGTWELLVARLSYEIEGQLRGGMSTEAIHAKWMEAEVEKVAEGFRSDPKEDEG